MRFPAPAPGALNGQQFRDELAAAGVQIPREALVVIGDDLVIDVAESHAATVKQVLAAHVPSPDYGVPDEDRQLRAIRAKAQEVAAGTGTFTAAQVQKVLAHLILRATRPGR